jgi:hypothetical protein
MCLDCAGKVGQGTKGYGQGPAQKAPLPPCKDVVRLRKAGWTYEAIARELKASTREAYRWQAGDSVMEASNR